MKALTLSFVLFFLYSHNDSPEFTIGRKVNPSLYSLNTGTSFWSCKEDNLNECMESSKDFMSTIIRFPGGLDANIYHMDGAGYGIRVISEDDVKRSNSLEKKSAKNPSSIERNRSKDPNQRKSTDLKSAEMSKGDESEDKMASMDNDDAEQTRYKGKKWEKDKRDVKNYSNGNNVIGTVIQFCKRTGTKMMFTCNMNDASYEENKMVLDTLINSGVEVAAIELGNEFYLKVYQDSKYPSPTSYIDTARYYTKRLRNDFPGIKIAIIAAPLKVIASNQKRVKYYDKWNEMIAKEDFYDAYIVHHYSKNESCPCTEKTDATQRSAMFDCQHKAMQDELQTWFTCGLNAYKKLFPNKKMWLTEWNTTMLNECYGNTQLANLYISRYQNELVKYSDQIEFATFHNWLGNGKKYPIIALKGNSFVKRSPYPVFSKLQPIFSQRETFELKIPSQLTTGMPETLKIYAYHQPKTSDNKGNIIIIVINPTSTDHTQKIFADKITINSEQYQLNNGKYTMSSSKSLAASLGNPEFGNSVESIITDSGVINSEIKFKGYSFTTITYEFD